MTVQELIDLLGNEDPAAFVELPGGVLITNVKKHDDEENTVVIE